MTEERILSERDRLLEVVLARLNFSITTAAHIDTEHVAALITDDILRSTVRIHHDTVMLERGRDAGYEKGLREAIAAVGGVERYPIVGIEGESRLINYLDAQLDIAKLSNHGMEELWSNENTGIVPPFILEHIPGHEGDFPHEKEEKND